MPDPYKIRRALLSVYDKTGIVDFARSLHDEFGIEIISTGGTAAVLTEAGVPVTLVEDVTDFPEMMDGRVKTLHPKIHAGILADRDNPDHMTQLERAGIDPIDMVVVNLYPFEKTIADPDCTFEQAIEMIDIGGPCLLRAAAKNHRHVLVIPGPDFASAALGELRQTGCVSESLRSVCASVVFRWISEYDLRISAYLGRDDAPLPNSIATWLHRTDELRYGENPSQSAAVYSDPAFTVARANLLTRTRRLADAVSSTDSATGGVQLAGGVDMSFNNYVDASAALELCAELTRAGSQLWHRFATGDSIEGKVWHRLATGDSANRGKVDQRITDERTTRRNLPHIQRPGATYFVTFRLERGQLSPTERTLALDACRFWHTKRMTLHAATIMPDHVHLLLTLHELESDRWVSLGELLHSIKRFSSREINRSRGASGALWQDETFDRVVRDEKEFHEKWEYIEANPVTAGVIDVLPYPWFWKSETDFMETVPGEHRLETGATDSPEHRLETSATAQGATEQDALAICVFIKHTNACGVGVADDPVEAYRRAYLGDPSAAMGGILAVNFPVDAALAEAVMDSLGRWGKAAGAGAFFVEVWLAPAFDEDAVQVIRTRKKWGRRVRLLDVGDIAVERDAGEQAAEMDIKRIAGGVLVQTRDLVGLDEEQWKIATKRAPTDAELNDLRLAWLVCKHTKSNAISICKDAALIGNGVGQTSRVMSCRIATWLARDNGHEEALVGAASASDGFFPFPDGPQLLADAGVTAIIQPGGSKRDAEVITACDARDVAMILTGTRHFRH